MAKSSINRKQGISVILAGGLSERFGRDKARFLWNGRSFVGHIRQSAREAGLPARVLRRDMVRRCGPLGGLYTAFRRHPAPWILFLACDMPMVRAEYLRQLLECFRQNFPSIDAVVTLCQGQTGFPLILSRSAFPEIQRRVNEADVSLAGLFKSLHVNTLKPKRTEHRYLVNINRPADLPLLDQAGSVKRS